MTSNHLAKDWVYIDKVKVYVNASGNGDARHLNATLPPTNVNSPTAFAYLATDGSVDAPYLKAS